MRKICYYVSDHGWGHAARSVAIIRELLARDGDIEIIVKADYALKFIQDSFKDEQSKVKFDRCQKDFGFALQPGSLQVDRERTENQLKRWLSSWDGFVKRETYFCKDHGVALIISDIAPQPFLVAHSLKIPGVAISNFTWYGVYSHLFGENEEVNVVREAYGHADLALVLPLAEDDLPFRELLEVGLVVRKPTVERGELRRRLGASPEEKVIYIGMGAIASSATVVDHLLDTMRLGFGSLNGVKFLVSSHVSVGDSKLNHRILKIHAEDPESQNYIAACDLVISKAGYSTVSEAISGRVPMFLVAREEISEDESIVRAVESLRIAERISISEDCGIEISSLIADTDGSFKRAYDQLPERYRRDGNREVAKHILKLIEDGVK